MERLLLVFLLLLGGCNPHDTDADKCEVPEDEPIVEEDGLVPKIVELTVDIAIHGVVTHVPYIKFKGNILTEMDNTTQENEEDYSNMRQPEGRYVRLGPQRPTADEMKDEEDKSARSVKEIIDILEAGEGLEQPLDDWGHHRHHGHGHGHHGHHGGHHHHHSSHQYGHHHHGHQHHGHQSHHHHHISHHKPVSLDFGCNADNHESVITKIEEGDGSSSSGSSGSSSSSSSNRAHPLNLYIKKPHHYHPRPHHHGPHLTFRCNTNNHRMFKYYKKAASSSTSMDMT